MKTYSKNRRSKHTNEAIQQKICVHVMEVNMAGLIGATAKKRVVITDPKGDIKIKKKIKKR